MFTGLIQTVGKIEAIAEDRIQITCTDSKNCLVLEDLAIGDSVAVDGVCLTVIKILQQGFVAIASPETLSRTTLGKLSETQVNLEASLRAGSKLGGHFVTGHVDGIGCLETSVITGSAWEMKFSAPTPTTSHWSRQIAPYIVSKGSVAVNGISLTVAECDIEGNWFKVAVIPHSFGETNLCYLQPGSLVNIETDILGKYVAKFLKMGSDRNLGTNQQLQETATVSRLEEITPDFLTENGFV